MELLSLLHHILNLFISLYRCAPSKSHFDGVLHRAKNSFVVIFSFWPGRSIFFRDAHSKGGLTATTLGIIAVVDDCLREGRTSQIKRLLLDVLDQVDVDRIGANVALHQRIEDYSCQGQELKLTLVRGKNRSKRCYLRHGKLLPCNLLFSVTICLVF